MSIHVEGPEVAAVPFRSISGLPGSSFPIFTTIAEYRKWRADAFLNQKKVGFVPTMGALHEGHLSLVRRSLAQNDFTVVSIFVNPAQFAPHEDLTTYPRTLDSDVQSLEKEEWFAETKDANTIKRRVSAVFLPGVAEMYPGGITQDVEAQKGTFVEVKGYGHQMEGSMRPTFFRGVATVVTKLFNVVQPTNAYFGQKDIQQALLLKRMCHDLLLSYPEPQNLHIVPTERDPASGLALSSRNAYLSEQEKKMAPTLITILRAAESVWKSGGTKGDCIAKAAETLFVETERHKREGITCEVKLDYVHMNNSRTFDSLPDNAVLGTGSDAAKEGVTIISGALWLGRTRLIDNVLAGGAVVWSPSNT